MRGLMPEQMKRPLLFHLHSPHVPKKNELWQQQKKKHKGLGPSNNVVGPKKVPASQALRVSCFFFSVSIIDIFFFVISDLDSRLIVEHALDIIVILFFFLLKAPATFKAMMNG